jgi:hypothetical protein
MVECVFANHLPEIVFAEYGTNDPAKVHSTKNKLNYRKYVATLCPEVGVVRDLKPNASMLLAIALICARPCLRGLSGSGMRSPIATNKICRRVAKWAVVGIVLFMVVIRGPIVGRFYRWEAARTDPIYVGRSASNNVRSCDINSCLLLPAHFNG